MKDALAELEALKEATRVRLTPEARQALGRRADAMHAIAGTRRERTEAQALFVLLEMHDKLEAIRHGQG